MNEIEFNGGKVRKEAYKKLKVFLANPGRFCLIVLGSRGTGKRFALENAFSKIQDLQRNDEELCLKNLKFIEPESIPIEEEELDKLLSENQYNTLVIEDVEQLSFEQQKLIFEALSTTDGTFGLKNKLKVRVAFTSSMDVDSLREDGDFLLGFFWDRISQLVVEFPSFKEESENIIKDFKEVWNKMDFNETEGYNQISAFPKNATLERFLEDFADKFEGGFRDLDKIACMYFNYRILNYSEKKRINEEIEKEIVSEIKKDFFGKTQLHSNATNDLSIFQIQPGLKMDEINSQFRIHIRKWALREFKTLKKASEKLGISQSTLKLYVKGKATKVERAKSKSIASR